MARPGRRVEGALLLLRTLGAYVSSIGVTSLATLKTSSHLHDPSHIIEDAYGESTPPPAFLETPMRPKQWLELGRAIRPWVPRVGLESFRVTRETAQDGPKDRPKTASDAPKRAPRLPKRAPRRPKIAPRRPERSPRGPPRRPGKRHNALNFARCFLCGFLI